MNSYKYVNKLKLINSESSIFNFKYDVQEKISIVKIELLNGREFF